MEVFPIPPVPIRAIGVKFSTRLTISWIKSLRPKQALGGGGGDSPGTLDVNVREWISQQPILLTWLESKGFEVSLYAMIRVWLSYVPNGSDSQSPLESLTRLREYRKPLYECSLLTRSEHVVSDIQLEADEIETYVEDIENPVEVQPPSTDRILVVLCVQQSRDWIPPILFDDLSLDLCHGSVTRNMVSKS